jgi:predicted DNA-binding helix-hairpin-helix protein
MRHFEPWDLLLFLKEAGVLLIALAGAAWAWFKFRHAHSWPSVQGTIVSAQVERSTDNNILPWVANLAYSYIVNGEYYSGFYRMRARSERRAEERIAGWKDRMVVVRYSPDKPDLSVLLKSDQPGGQLGN